MTFRKAGRSVVVAGATLCLAFGAIGCLSDDTSLSAPVKDAGLFDTGVPVFDASGSVDGAGQPPVDAGVDAPVVDSAMPDAALPDAGKDSGLSQLGVVAGGTVGHSTNYKMTETTAPATAPVMRSPKYKLVGGMSVTSQH